MPSAIEERSETQTLRVVAPIDEPGSSLTSESMHASQDPAAEDQAVLLNAPFWIDWLNFGDVVRVGPEGPESEAPCDCCRPILDVVVASGHRRVMAIIGAYELSALRDRLLELFPDYALRIEGDGDQVLSVSVHPDLSAEEVSDAIADWLDEQGADPDDEDIALSPTIETRLGPVTWPR